MNLCIHQLLFLAATSLAPPNLHLFPLATPHALPHHAHPYHVDSKLIGSRFLLSGNAQYRLYSAELYIPHLLTWVRVSQTRQWPLAVSNMSPTPRNLQPAKIGYGIP